MLTLLALMQDTATVVGDSVARAVDTIVSPGTEYALEGAGQLLVVAFGALGVLAQELLKKVLKFVGVWDSKLGALLKPVQQVLAGVLGVAIALLWSKLGLMTDAPTVELLLTAPVGTLLGVGFREAALRLGSK